MELIFMFLLVAVLEAVEKNHKIEEAPEVEINDLRAGDGGEKESYCSREIEPC